LRKDYRIGILHDAQLLLNEHIWGGVCRLSTDIFEQYRYGSIAHIALPGVPLDAPGSPAVRQINHVVVSCVWVDRLRCAEMAGRAASLILVASACLIQLQHGVECAADAAGATPTVGDRQWPKSRRQHSVDTGFLAELKPIPSSTLLEFPTSGRTERGVNESGKYRRNPIVYGGTRHVDHRYR